MSYYPSVYFAPTASTYSQPSGSQRSLSYSSSSRRPATELPSLPTYTSSQEMSESEDRLPPYVRDTGLPAYTPPRQPDPVTLAMYLFKFGFLFPPLWILGSIILFVPIRLACFSPCSNGVEKPDPESQSGTRYRNIEIKWAKRCFAALSLFLCVGVGLAISIWGGVKMISSTKKS